MRPFSRPSAIFPKISTSFEFTRST
jgi:hypothetical protein